MESPSPRSRHPRSSSAQRAPLLSGRESWSVDTSSPLRQVSSTNAQKTTLNTDSALEHLERSSTPDLSLLGSRTARTREAKHFSNPFGSDRSYKSPFADESRAQTAEAYTRRRREREATRQQVGIIDFPQAGIDGMDNGQLLATHDLAFRRAILNEQAVENLPHVSAEDFYRPVPIPRPTQKPMPVQNTLPRRVVEEPVGLINVHYTISEDRCGDEESVMAQRLAALGDRHKQTVFSEQPGSSNNPRDRRTAAQDTGFGIEPSKGLEPDWEAWAQSLQTQDLALDPAVSSQEELRRLDSFERLPTQPPYRAYLANLGYAVTEAYTKDFLWNCEPTEVRLVKDRITGTPRGDAYAEFATLGGLKKALKLDGSQLVGRTVYISIAAPGESPASLEMFTFSSQSGARRAMHSLYPSSAPGSYSSTTTASHNASTIASHAVKDGWLPYPRA